jgi:hypothetical protein
VERGCPIFRIGYFLLPCVSLWILINGIQSSISKCWAAFHWKRRISDSDNSQNPANGLASGSSLTLQHTHHTLAHPIQEPSPCLIWVNSPLRWHPSAGMGFIRQEREIQEGATGKDRQTRQVVWSQTFSLYAPLTPLSIHPSHLGLRRYHPRTRTSASVSDPDPAPARVHDTL